MPDKFYEKDLYEPVKDYFERKGYEVKAEVDRCDVVALKDEDIVVVELKKSLNLELILQAVERQKIAHQVFVAVPKPTGRVSKSSHWNDVCYLLKRLEVGLLTVEKLKSVYMVHDAVPYDRFKSVIRSHKSQEHMVKEFDQREGDYNVGGSTGKKLMTSYRQSVLKVAFLLKKFGELSPKEIRVYDETLYGAAAILEKNHYGWFKREPKDRYKLNEKGLREIVEYEFLEETLIY